MHERKGKKEAGMIQEKAAMATTPLLLILYFTEQS